MEIIRAPTVKIGAKTIDFFPIGTENRIIMRIQPSESKEDGDIVAVFLGATSEIGVGPNGLVPTTSYRELGRAACEGDFAGDRLRRPEDLVEPLAALFRDLTWPPVRCARGTPEDFDLALRAAAAATVPVGEQIEIIIERETNRVEIYLGVGGNEVPGLDRRTLNAFVLDAVTYHEPGLAPVLFGDWRYLSGRRSSIEIPPVTAHARLAGAARMAEIAGALRALGIEPRDPATTPEITEDIPF